MCILLYLEITSQTTYPMDVFTKICKYKLQRYSLGYSLREKLKKLKNKPTVHQHRGLLT